MKNQHKVENHSCMLLRKYIPLPDTKITFNSAKRFREEASTLMEDIELGIKCRKIRRLQQTKDRELLSKLEKKDENQFKQIQEIKRLIQEIKQNEAEEIITRSYNINSHTSYIERKKG